ncbi:MAG TPA: dihydroorotate dehydrogenase [Longimicrobiales bacterium]
MNLAQTIFGVTFQNPVLLASGTCGYGDELDGLLDLDALGGIVLKAVTVEPRDGNPAPRVAEYGAGMLNSVGLANVGLRAMRADKLPGITSRLRRANVLVNVAGRTAEEYGEIVAALDDVGGFAGYELNVSCPNVREGGAVFCSREDLLAAAVRNARRATRRPITVKLAPNVPDIGRMAEVAVDEGADALTLINTMPGLLFDLDTRRPVLGAGTGGVSGPALLPMGVYAVAQARRRVGVPILGAGGIRTGADALQYLFAGASLVQIGTATFADPRTALRVLAEITSYGEHAGAGQVADLVGAGTLS